MVWDNSNIIESYSGVTTPMTFSFIRRAYSIVYHCFCEVMGISPRVVQQNQDALENMLGFFHGRVYYNLKNWYRLVRMFPGYRYNSRFMESMMGVKQSLELEDDLPPAGWLRRWLVELPSLILLLLRSGWNFLRIQRIVRRFEQHFYAHYDQWSQIDFDKIEPRDIKRLYDMMEREMLWNWKAPIINDFYVMVFYGTLRKLCVAWCGDETASLQNGLVCGEGGLLSDEPAKQILRMTRAAGEDPVLRDTILREPLESLPELIDRDARFEAFRSLMSQYLKDFGLRCSNELKLESYSHLDQPHRVYQIIRSYLAREDESLCDVEAIEQREHEIRQTAELQAEQLLKRTGSWIPRRLLFRWVLKNARLGIRNRENMRLARTRIYGILRHMLRSIGRKLEFEGILDDREDIFYLTIDELWDYLKGTAVTTDLRGLTQFRRAEYDRYRNEASPGDRFETHELPYQCLQKTTASDSVPTGRSLRGISCCPGVVTGTAQVIEDPSRESRFTGTILVAEHTDPGWIPLYPAFAGLLVERGSVLSHSAIVAREMGIPTIVGIPGLTDRIASGQRLRMNGGTGTVELLPGPEAVSGVGESQTSRSNRVCTSSTQN
jgi:pyruvate,water dikinase